MKGRSTATAMLQLLPLSKKNEKLFEFINSRLPVAVCVDVLKILCAGNEAWDAPVIAQEKREREGKSEKKGGRACRKYKFKSITKM